MTIPLTDQQLAEYATAVAAYQQHAPTGFACCTAHPAADAAAALLAEVHRLRTELAELQEAQRLEWVMSQSLTPHTSRLCACGHSHHAHTVPAPHSCFAHGKTCPCPAYRQLPHDEAIAQLKRNQQAAIGRAAAEESHVVADGSSDPAHTDDHPGREPAAVVPAGVPAANKDSNQ